MRLIIRVKGFDDEESAELSRNLRTELLDSDVDDVVPAESGPGVEGAKSGSAIVAGSLLVTVAPTVVRQAMDIVSSWLRRQRTDVEIEICGQKIKGPVTAAQRDQLVAIFLEQARVITPGNSDIGPDRTRKGKR
jgi:hypothetical protein